MTRSSSLQAMYQRIQQLSQLSRFDEAKTVCEEVLRLAPAEAVAWYCLGEIELGRQQPAAAASAFRNAVGRERNNLQYLRGLCLALHDSQQWPEAIAASRKYLARRHDDGEMWGKLARACEAASLPADAASAYESCLALQPDNIPAAVRCADLFCLAQEPARGLEVVERMLGNHRNEPRLWLVHSQICLMRKRWPEGIESARQCVALEPANAQARLLLAVGLMRMWHLEEAESQCREIVAREERNADALGLLGLLMRMQGRTPEALALFETAARFSTEPRFQSNVLLTMQYLDGVSAASLYTAHVERAPLFGGLPASRPPERQGGTSGEPLRLGLVSADLGIQATSFLALPLLEALNKAACVTCIYSDRTDEDDELTGRFKRAAGLWRNTAGWPTARFVEQVKADKIDVLVDLMGHTGHRLAVFTERAAPFQATWLGYVGTTGLKEIDFLIADRFHVPQGEEPYYAERVLRLPNGYVCYQPLFATPEVQPLPAMTNGFVTFGSFNNPSKYSATTLRVWAEVLKAVPQSRLLLKYGGLDSAPFQARVRKGLADFGVAGERIVFSGWSSVSELFSHYHGVDIALDTQPYSGGVTTCEALWMGVPVITCPGKTFASRHTTSHLTNAGYPHFVAEDIAGYVELAVHWAGQLDALAAVRRDLRSRLAASPLCDAPRFAQDFLALLREMVGKTW